MLDCKEPKWKGYIRPFSFILTLVFVMVLTVFDGNIMNFHVVETWRNILEAVLVTMVVALFGSRGIEKTTSIWASGKRNSGDD